MEDYDKFVQHRLSQLRKSDEQQTKLSPASSLIRFHGQPILPPLLSLEQREEMQQLRHAAQKAAVHRKLKDDKRIAHVQTTLHSVQLRKTPTLEEFLQELENNVRSSNSHNTRGGTVSQNKYVTGQSGSLLLSLLPERKEKDGVPLPPLTSTTCSAFLASDVIPQQSYQEGCLINQYNCQQESQPSSLNCANQQSVSSGYMTYENVENATCVSGGIDAGGESHGSGSLEGAFNSGGFFLHNTSNTIARMPDIISHPPIDGEELERSGLELSFGNDFVVAKDICCSSLQSESTMCGSSPVEKSKSSLVDTTEDEDNHAVTATVDLDRDHSLDRIKGPVSSSENSGFADNPDLSQTLGTGHCPTAELHIKHNLTEPANSSVDETEPSEEPYRLSLQALLKKSQEYRRRQRMLRNQARNAKFQERTQEQPRARTEEPSLSDKENDEFPHRGTGTAERKKTKERRGNFIPSVETSEKSWKNERMIACEFFGKMANFNSARINLTENENTKETAGVEEDTTFKENKLNISQGLITEHKQIGAFPQQQHTLTETSPVEEAFYLTTCPTAFHKEVGKHHRIPALKFCKSPVHFKNKGSIQDGGTATSKRKILVNTGLHKDLEHQNSHTAVPSAENLVVPAKSSQHIDQLESSLSSLKVLISDLESTLTENLGNRSRTEGNTQREFSYECIKHSEPIKEEQHMWLRQSDCDHWEDKLRGHGDNSVTEQSQRHREWQRGQSSDDSKIVLEDAGPEPRVSDTDDVPSVVQVEGTEAVNLGELRLVKTLVAERAKDEGPYKEGLTKRYDLNSICRKQRPPTKCILSETQRLRIPDVFRHVPSETTALRDASMLSDDHPVEKGNETAVEGHDSTHMPSLNQSYDVDAPSGLWFLEGLGTDLGSKGRLVQEKHLNPESLDEGQGGTSRAKRRLLMHVMEETRDKSAGTCRGAGSVVRPNSSTPQAALRWHEGHGSQKDKEEQLKQAHAAQLRALQEEHKRQQEELLQALAVCRRQSVSFPCSMSSSRLGDTLTFSTLSQPSSPLSECYRPLLLAAVKGFLTRRLLKTERVAQLVRTIRDTRQFLQALQQQSPSTGQFCSRQDLLLQERVALQLRAARYEVNDIFFSLSAAERMQLISWDRELVWERELRRQSGQTGQARRKSSLSAATQKSLERRRAMMIQKKAAGRHQGALTRTAHDTGSSAEQLPETK